jgi:hypothetical protein
LDDFGAVKKVEQNSSAISLRWKFWGNEVAENFITNEILWKIEFKILQGKIFGRNLNIYEIYLRKSLRVKFKYQNFLCANTNMLKSSKKFWKWNIILILSFFNEF